MNHTLAFQISGDRDELEVHMDAEGLDVLIANLQQIRNGMAREGQQHVHMFVEDWGGDELSSESVSSDDMKIVKKVTLYGWPEKRMGSRDAHGHFDTEAISRQALDDRRFSVVAHVFTE